MRCETGSCVDVLDVDTGGTHVCAVTSDGAVWCWGHTAEGQAGVIAGSPLLRPARVAGIDGAVAVAANYEVSCALKGDGTVWCWGWGWCLGIGDSTVRTTVPLRVSSLDRVIAIEDGGSYMCALRDDGTVWCWGRSYRGIFGDGASGAPESLVPRRIPDLPPLVQLAAGGIAACGLDAEGGVWCWGANEHGELGRGYESGAERPGRVEGLPPARSVAGGSWHACALVEDGRVWCWGAAAFGALGDGTTGSSWVHVTVPQPVRRGRSDYVAIDAGDFTTCAITVTGDPWCWGSNVWGGLADGTTENRGDPVRPVGLTDIAQIDTNSTLSCFLSQAGALSCSGWNLHGEVGDGTTTVRLVATAVAW